LSHDWVEYSIKESPYTGATFAVHMVLAHHADKNTGMCWPSQDLIAEEARVTVRTVKRSIKQMCDDGYLERSYRHRQRRYRLLVSNGEGTPVSPQKGHPRPLRGDISDPSEGTPVSPAYRTVTEPSEEPSDEPKSTGPSGPGEGVDVKIGNLSEDADMPEMDVTRKPKRKLPFKAVPPVGTNDWLLYRFEQERARAGVRTGRYNKGHLNHTFRSLRDDDGMTNAEIEVLIRTFFVRHGDVARTKVREWDLSSLFRQMVPQLQIQARDTTRAVRDGRKTTTQKGKELSGDLLARFGVSKDDDE
jgi:hypothetical protein